MRAEAEIEGKQGMLLVDNVGVNRVRVDCLDFKAIRDIQDTVFQSPGGFEATTKSYFYQRAREVDKALARMVIAGERFHPATRSLWLFEPPGECPAQWYNLTNRTLGASKHTVSTLRQLKITREFKFERMITWYNIIGTRLTLNKCNNNSPPLKVVDHLKALPQRNHISKTFSALIKANLLPFT